MQPATGGHRRTVEDGRDLGGREPLPLRQQQDLAVTRVQSAERVVDDFVAGSKAGQSEDALAVSTNRSRKARRRLRERCWFARTLRAVAYSQIRAPSPSGSRSSRRHAVRNTSDAASSAALIELARQRQYATMSEL
jgi:hypothetical protein